MEYLFSKCEEEHESKRESTCNLILPEVLVSRWKRQMKTKYKDLPENEKESDRKEAQKILDIINAD